MMLSEHLQSRHQENNLEFSMSLSKKRKTCHTVRKNEGYITLVSVLVVGAVGVSVAVSLLLLGLSVSRTSFVEGQFRQARLLADSCAEEALEQIRDATSFSGSGTLSLGNGTCAYTVTSGSGSNRTITVSGTVGSIVRHVSISVDAINPFIHVASWQEN